MNKLRKQATDTRDASEPKESESPHKILARRMLEQWAKEMNRGEGAPNILAVFERLGDGDPVFHISPGPIFSPMAQRTEAILRDVRLFEPRMANLLIAIALEIPHQQLANSANVSKWSMQSDMREALGAFQMGVYYHSKKVREHEPKKPRKMIRGDIYP